MLMAGRPIWSAGVPAGRVPKLVVAQTPMRVGQQRVRDRQDDRVGVQVDEEVGRVDAQAVIADGGAAS